MRLPSFRDCRFKSLLRYFSLPAIPGFGRCKAGVVDPMLPLKPLNARPVSQRDEGLAKIAEALVAHNLTNPDWPAARSAANQIVNDRLDRDMAVCGKYKVPVVTPGENRTKANDAVHGSVGVVMHYVIDEKFAKAPEKGTDGSIAMAGGAGGHAGMMSLFAQVQNMRGWLDRALALSGEVATGRAVVAAQAMGGDFADIGSASIATLEAIAWWRLCVRFFAGSVKSEQIVEAISTLEQQVAPPRLTIWRGVGAHKGRLAGAWLEALYGQIAIALLLLHAHGQNQVEAILAHLKKHGIAQPVPIVSERSQRVRARRLEVDAAAPTAHACVPAAS